MRHQCMIYEGSPGKQLPGLAALLREKLKAGNRVLYLNSPAMVAGIRSYLSAGGIDVVKEVGQGSLILTSAQDHLVNGRFDSARMLEMLGNAIDQSLKDGYQGLFATGDMSWEFGSEKDFSRLLDYEWGLEELFRKQPALCGICQYHAQTLPADVVQQGLHVHEAVYISETLSRLNPYYLPPESLAAQRSNLSNGSLSEALKNLEHGLDS